MAVRKSKKQQFRHENGFGSIVKLSGNRRKPFAVRITTGWQDGKQVRNLTSQYSDDIGYHQNSRAASYRGREKHYFYWIILLLLISFVVLALVFGYMNFTADYQMRRGNYYLKAEDESIVKATTEYSTCIHASVEKDNIFACQFHPEKSSDVGLQILKNFVELA